jgi:flagellar protein FliS
MGAPFCLWAKLLVVENQAEKLKKKFEAQSISTASPEMCVVMLYERLVDDLECAIEIFDSKDFKPVFDVLMHGQHIVRLLRAAMRVDIWPEGANLISLYNWFEHQISQGSMFQNKKAVEEVIPLIRQLRDTWKMVADKVLEAKEEGKQEAFSETRIQIADFLA